MNANGRMCLTSTGVRFAQAALANESLPPQMWLHQLGPASAGGRTALGSPPSLLGLERSREHPAPSAQGHAEVRADRFSDAGDREVWDREGAVQSGSTPAMVPASSCFCRARCGFGVGTAFPFTFTLRAPPAPDP